MYDITHHLYYKNGQGGKDEQHTFLEVWCDTLNEQNSCEIRTYLRTNMSLFISPGRLFTSTDVEPGISWASGGGIDRAGRAIGCPISCCACEFSSLARVRENKNGYRSNMQQKLHSKSTCEPTSCRNWGPILPVFIQNGIRICYRSRLKWLDG